MRSASLLFFPICALTGSLALPQTISGSSISLPGVDLSPADQTACIQSCSQSVADNRPDALDACLDATGKSAPNCLCNDATLSAEMQKCFGARCPPLQGRCAAILGGSSSISGTGLSSTGSPGTPGTGNQSAGPSVSLPGVQLPQAQQTACVQSCSDDVAANVPDALDACIDATGNSAANCLCTDSTLAAEMQKCFGARCALLQGRCAAIIEGGIFIAGTTGSTGTGSTGTSTGGTVGGGTSAPGGAGTSSPGTAGAATPGTTGTGTPGDASVGAPGGSADSTPGGSADGASGSSSNNGVGGNSPGAFSPGAPAGAQPSPASAGGSSGTNPSAAQASPSTPSSAADDLNPDAGNPDNSAGVNGAAPLALALGLALAFFL